MDTPPTWPTSCPLLLQQTYPRFANPMPHPDAVTCKTACALGKFLARHVPWSLGYCNRSWVLLYCLKPNNTTFQDLKLSCFLSCSELLFCQGRTPLEQLGSKWMQFQLRQPCKASVFNVVNTWQEPGIVMYIQEPCCRRKTILAYFGEKSPKCHQQSELPCDYCKDSKHVSRASASVEEALQAKAAAAATLPNVTDSRAHKADYASGKHKDGASCGTSPSASRASEPAACVPQSAGLWRTAAKRPAPAKPLLSRNHKVQAVAAQAQEGDNYSGKVQYQVCSVSQTEAQADRHIHGVSNMRRARFKVPYKVPRPSS